MSKQTSMLQSAKPALDNHLRSSETVGELEQEDVYYPSSDGEPMAESDPHRDQMIDLLNVLAERYRDRPDVYVTGNLFLYYKQGDPNLKVAPDVMVVEGVEKRRRPSYRLWEDKKAPALVIEVTSESTKYEDLYAKRALYEDLGVKEYYLFDPLAEYLPEQLVAYRRVRGRFVQMKPRRGGRMSSDVLGLDLVVADGWLRLYDPAAGQLLPTYGELEAARQRAEAEREREAEARQRAEAELAQLRAQLEERSEPSRQPATRRTRRKR